MNAVMKPTPDMSRRKMLSTTAIAGVALGSVGVLGACTTPAEVLPAVLDVINKVIAGTCQIVPIIATLVDVIVAVFPAAAGVSVITDALAQQIATYVCNLFKDSGLQDGKHPNKLLTAKVGNGSIELHCWMPVNNKLMYV